MKVLLVNGSPHEKGCTHEALNEVKNALEQEGIHADSFWIGDQPVSYTHLDVYKRQAYNHGREDRKWRIWKEAEEKLLRECGVDEATIEQIRMADRADFNSNRRFYRWTNDVAEYLEDMADRERQAEVNTVAELLDEIESENLYQVLVTVDGRTLKIVLATNQKPVCCVAVARSLQYSTPSTSKYIGRQR